MFMEKIKDMLCDELAEISNQEQLDINMIDTIDKITHAIKSIEAISSMKHSYDKKPYYDDGYSQRRNRDYMGRYSKAESHMVEKLEKMMEEATDERVRNAIEKALVEIQQ